MLFIIMVVLAILFIIVFDYHYEMVESSLPLTVAFDLMLALMMCFQICNISAQAISIHRLIKFTIERVKLRIICQTFSMLLMLIYLNQNFWFLSRGWGLPTVEQRLYISFCYTWRALPDGEFAGNNSYSALDFLYYYTKLVAKNKFI